MPRSEQQFEALRKRSREKILSAALELFAERGYDATPVSAIAKKAGVAAGLLYNYFDSKDDLLKGIIHNAQEEFRVIVAATLKAQGKPDLGAFMTALLAAMKSRHNEWRVVIRVILQPGASRVMQSAEVGFEQHLLRAIRTLKSEKGGGASSHLPELLHAVLLVFLITENEKVARKLLSLVVEDGG